MGRRSIKENKSVYMLTRESCELTREEASDLIGCITPSRLEKLENARTTVQPEDVVLMARAYKEPGLCNYYCTHECAIGKRNVNEISEKELPQIAIEMVNGISRLNSKKDVILQLAEDGTITADEYKDFEDLNGLIDKLSESVETLKLWIDKATATGEIKRGFERL